ncbi:MAG: HPr(Ser) kinase/phosphatase [Chthoniobacterales bacterium]|jgi:HPr kinase/phosphorylase|nr:HPr(Ser) kinase/phosphatase [Chthoniobacterales bacterium]
MARTKDPLFKSLSVGKFFADHGPSLELELIGDSVGMERPIAEPTINRPGLALAGFFRYFASKRVQVAGHAELSYLRSLPAEERATRIKSLFEQQIPCLVIARGLPLPTGLLEFAAKSETPVFRTPLVTMKFINSATIALEDEFAPVASEHGSMVDIMGMGVLIRGASGIGKSECVLGLIERGYSLVSDDITRFRNLEGRELIGNSKELTRFHMEVRGIGIINVAAIFGAGSVRPEKRLDLIVTLKDWHDVEEIDRLGLDRDAYEILGIPIPHVTIPVRPSRDLARLVEVAALNQKLRGMGHDTAREFNDRLLRAMKPARDH